MGRCTRGRGFAFLALLGAFAAGPACRARSSASSGIGAAALDLAEVARRQLGIDLPARSVSERRLRELEGRLRRRLGPRCGDGRDPGFVRRGCLDRFAELFFGELGFRREIDDRSLSPSLLPWVLEHRRGSCVGLGSLVLALGEPLGITLEGVLVPSHFFVRHRGPEGGRGLELLKEAREMPERWYRERYAVPRGNPLYLRGLRPEETLEVLRFNLANALRERGELGRAVLGYRQVIEMLPDFAEAQANLGLCYQRLGEHRRAEEAYRRAARSHPGLEGIEQNLERLGRDRRRPADAR